MKKLASTIFYVLVSFISAYAQNDFDTATNYYNSGVDFLNKGDYLNADSLFTLSVNKYFAVDAFFNRALAREKLGNKEGFCNDVYMATANGDSEARNAFLKNCTVNDTTYFDGKTRIMAKHKYDFNIDSVIIDSSGKQFWYDVTDTIPLSHEDSLALKKSQTLPVFPGKEEFIMFIVKNVHYPPVSREKGIQGMVFVSFVISREGNVEDIKITKGINDELDKEAMRVVSISPQWFPGMQKGKFVNVQYSMPIKFSIR